jgi:hypothetical protein
LQNAATPPFIEQVERTVAMLERLSQGPYRARELTVWDEDVFKGLWADAPEKADDWEVFIERSPNAFAQFELQPAASITAVEADGDLVACTVWSPANCMVGGKRVSIHYAQGLRVRAEHRRDGLGDLVRRFPTRALQRPTLGQVMYRRIGNANMERFLDAVKFHEGQDRLQKIVGAAYLAARGPDVQTEGLRPIELRDLERCAHLINRTHEGLDLFRPYGAESLRDMLDGGVWGERPPWRPSPFGWDDFHVIERDGHVVACGGLWDRGRDIREIWRSAQGDEKRVEVAMGLDLGVEAGHESALADLLRVFAARSGLLGRQSLVADLAHLPAVVEELDDLEPRMESRIIEWSPFQPSLPKQLGECYLDLRFW